MKFLIALLVVFVTLLMLYAFLPNYFFGIISSVKGLFGGIFYAPLWGDYPILVMVITGTGVFGATFFMMRRHYTLKELKEQAIIARDTRIHGRDTTGIPPAGQRTGDLPSDKTAASAEQKSS